MDDKTLIAMRVAQEMKDGTLVNLGIGLPTLVVRYLPPAVGRYRAHGHVSTETEARSGKGDRSDHRWQRSGHPALR